MSTAKTNKQKKYIITWHSTETALILSAQQHIRFPSINVYESENNDCGGWGLSFKEEHHETLKPPPSSLRAIMTQYATLHRWLPTNVCGNSFLTSY